MQKKGAADVVLPSKLTGILSAGGYSLITAEQDTEPGRLCKKFPGIAECVEPEDSAAFIAGLEVLMAAVSAAQSHNTVARQYALDYLSKKAVLGRFETDIQSLISSD